MKSAVWVVEQGDDGEGDDIAKSEKVGVSFDSHIFFLRLPQDRRGQETVLLAKDE